MPLLLAALFLLLAAAPVHGQELTVLYGATNELRSPDHSFAYQVEYRQALGEHFAWSASYLNEGHLPNHHRDGLAPLNLWGRVNMLDRRLSLAAGAGPYLFADTTTPPGGVPQDRHDVGGLAALSATLYLDYRLLLEARVNWVVTEKTIDTLTTLVGIGIQLEPPPGAGPVARPRSEGHEATKNEITAFVGETAVNNPGSPKSVAWSVEYRRGLFSFLDVSAAWMNEGDNRLIRRNGIITEGWLVRDFWETHLSLGGGVGAYFAVDKRGGPHPGQGGSAFASGVMSATASLRNFGFLPHVTTRFTFNRIITNYDKDTDTFMFGIGYQF